MIDREQYERDKAFAATELGQAYMRMIAALGHAWVVDTTPSSSDKKMKEVWDKSEAATKEFRRLLDELIARAPPSR